MPRPSEASQAEREYLRKLNLYQKTFQKFLREALEEAVPNLKDEAGEELPRQDAWRMDANVESTLRALFKSVQTKLEAAFPNSVLRKWAAAMIGSVNNTSKRNTSRAARVADVEIEPLLTDKGLNPYFQNVIDENVGLIRSISEKKLPELKNKLVSLITQDARNSTIADALQDHFNLTKNEAKLIAVDQIGKLNGALDQYRQEAIGGKRYRWRTAKDERVAGNPSGKYPHAKPSHWAREGKIYYWSRPPKGGHPKQRVRCRCWAEMILEDIVE